MSRRYRTPPMAEAVGHPLKGYRWITSPSWITIAASGGIGTPGIGRSLGPRTAAGHGCMSCGVKPFMARPTCTPPTWSGCGRQAWRVPCHPATAPTVALPGLASALRHRVRGRRLVRSHRPRLRPDAGGLLWYRATEVTAYRATRPPQIDGNLANWRPCPPTCSMQSAPTACGGRLPRRSTPAPPSRLPGTRTTSTSPSASTTMQSRSTAAPSPGRTTPSRSALTAGTTTSATGRWMTTASSPSLRSARSTRVACSSPLSRSLAPAPRTATSWSSPSPKPGWASLAWRSRRCPASTGR